MLSGSWSSTVARMPLANSRRPTICPKRPKPTMITLPSRLDGVLRALRRAAPPLRRSVASTTSGVRHIDSATTSVSSSFQLPGSTCAAPATPKTTNANSLPCASTAANIGRRRAARPMGPASAQSAASFSAV
jgi:hypothetical protein